MDKEKSYAYLKIYFYLLDKISSEEYPIGSLIPTQIELSEKFSVSRLTVREAIKELTLRGLLYSVKGRGTIVIAKPLKTDNDLKGFSNTVENNDESIVRSQVLCIKVMPAEKTVAAKLKVPPFTPVTYISRVRYVNNEPVSVQDTYLLNSFVKDIDFQSENLSSGSLYTLLKEKAGIVFYYVDEEYHAVVCPKEVSAHLGITEGVPIIKSLRVAYNSANIPIEYNENYGSSVVYRTVLRMKSTALANDKETGSQHFWDKIYGSVACAALGDAMGALSEAKAAETIKELFGGYVDDLKGGVADAFEAGSITGCFNRAYETALEVLQNKGALEEHTVSVLPDLAAPLQNEPTNGAALDVLTLGLFAHENVDEAIDMAIDVCMTNHPNNVSLSGAAAVTAAVYAAMRPEAAIDDVISAGIYGAARGDKIARQKTVSIPSASIEKRIKLAVSIGMKSVGWEETMLELRDVIGTSPFATESIPIVFGIIAANKGDAMEAIKMAVNIGGSTSAAAAMTGAIMGALHGIKSVPGSFIRTINRVNGINLERLAKKIYNTVYEDK